MTSLVFFWGVGVTVLPPLPIASSRTAAAPCAALLPPPQTLVTGHGAVAVAAVELLYVPVKKRRPVYFLLLFGSLLG